MRWLVISLLTLMPTQAWTDEPVHPEDAEILKDLEFFENLAVAESHEMLLDDESNSDATADKEKKQ